jgi:Domain of unknown function (DUF4278)
MQLSYRGIKYERQVAPIVTIPHEIIVKYRGAELKTQHHSMLVVSQKLVNLKYRGICYKSSSHRSTTEDIAIDSNAIAT